MRKLQGLWASRATMCNCCNLKDMGVSASVTCKKIIFCVNAADYRLNQLRMPISGYLTSGRPFIWGSQTATTTRPGYPITMWLSQAKLTPTRNTFPNDPRTYLTVTSRFTTAPNPSSNQVISRTRDHGNLSHDWSCDSSRDLSIPNMSCDLTTHDPGNITHDLPKSWPSNMSQDHTWFGHATCLLINTWKTVGRINKHVTVDQSTKMWLIGAMPQQKTWDNLQPSAATHPLYLYLP